MTFSSENERYNSNKIKEFCHNPLSGLYLEQVLWLKQIELHHFKNYTQVLVRPGEQVNCFVGKNASGKTNLLDAIYYLSFTKSFFNAIDQQNIQHGQDWMTIEGLYEHKGMEEGVRLVLQKGEKKQLKVNNNDVKKFSEHIGNFPLVMITPNDTMLIQEGSEERRKFLDGMISQMDKVYLNDLLTYNRVLEQRNRQMKLFYEQQYMDATLLDTYNEQLLTYGQSIFEKRRSFLQSFIPVFREYYKKISSSDEVVDLVYESHLNEQSFKSLLEEFQQSDLAAQRTTKGIHKDELEFTIDGFPLKKYGSQGQQKSFIISLKLAQYAYLKERTGIKPLLLLDDIFEKLDEERLNKLLRMISEDEFGQIFITDTHLERLQQVFEGMKGVQVNYFRVEGGEII